MKSITSTQENVTVLMDIIWSMEFALNVLLEKPMMNILKPAAFLLARDSMKNFLLSLKPVFASLNMSRSEEFAQLATLATTTIATVIDVCANLAMKNMVVSVSQSVLLIKPTSTEDVNAQVVRASSTDNVDKKENVLSIHIGMKRLTAVSVTLVSELLMENAVTINIVELMDILNMVNAIVKMDFSGFWVPAEHVDKMKLSMELRVSAILDIPETTTETVLNPTSDPTVTTMKDMMKHLRLVFVSKELSS